jgi:L-idonate 5-dehydrogenase
VVINAAGTGPPLADYSADKGYFDVVFECTGAGCRTQAGLSRSSRPRGTIVQVGVSGGADIPINALVAKEIRWSARTASTTNMPSLPA